MTPLENVQIIVSCDALWQLHELDSVTCKFVDLCYIPGEIPEEYNVFFLCQASIERFGSRKRTEALWFRYILKPEYIENLSP